MTDLLGLPPVLVDAQLRHRRLEQRRRDPEVARPVEQVAENVVDLDRARRSAGHGTSKRRSRSPSAGAGLALYRILVNNAAYLHEAMGTRPFWDAPVDLANIIGVGLRCHHVATYYAAPLLIAGRRSLVVNISFYGDAKDSEGFNRIGSHWKNGVYQRVMLLRSIS